MACDDRQQSGGHCDNALIEQLVLKKLIHSIILNWF